jgi:regulator of replication initiation timing
MHQEIIGMQQENKNLQVSLSESRERLQKHLTEIVEKKAADKKRAASAKKAPR